MTKTELLNQHTSPITLLPSGYYYTRLGGLDIYDHTTDMINNRGEGIINWLNVHEVF